MRPAGGNFATLQRYAREVWGISTDHFDPDGVRREALRPSPAPLEEILVADRPTNRRNLKERLYAAGLKERSCELCGQDEVWQGRRMTLILDHVNGVADDNRLENLRIVCPNCNATLDTHCARNLRQPPVDRRCARCGASFRPRSSRQRYCSSYCGQRHDRAGRPNPRAPRVERPPYEQLVAEVAADGWSAVGRRYGVSDNAIRKWVRAYERERSVPADVDGDGGGVRQADLEQAAARVVADALLDRPGALRATTRSTVPEYSAARPPSSSGEGRPP